MVLALAAAVTAWHFMQAAQETVDRLHPDALKVVANPTWISVLWAALPLAPYLLALVLLSTRRAASVAAGAGVAGGLFACFLVLAPFMAMGLVLGFGLSQAPYFGHTAISLLVFHAIGLWVVIAAVWTGKANWGVFFVAASATIVCLVSSYGSLRSAEIEWHRAYEQQEREDEFYGHRPRPIGARPYLMYLASCLFENHFAHPEFPYPADIDPQTRWGCDTRFHTDAVPGFKLSYTPQIDPATGKVVDFQLVALPKTKGTGKNKPLMIDRRGIVFVADPWKENVPPEIMATPGDGESSQIDALKRNIERYTKEKNDGVAPAVLTAEIIGIFPYETPAVDQSGTYLQTTNFSYVYLAPKPEARNQFGIIAQCQSYAKNCLRSYFLDYDGVIHATAEPRQPEREDPPVLDCEIVASACKDVRWSLR